MANLENVKLVKFPDFDEGDQKVFDGALDRFFNKIGAGGELQLSLKQYKKGGLRAQHEIHAHLEIGGASFFAERNGWLLLEVIQEALKVLEKEVKKKDSLKK